MPLNTFTEILGNFYRKWGMTTQSDDSYERYAVTKFPSLSNEASAQNSDSPIAIRRAVRAEFYTGLTWTQPDIFKNAFVAI